MSPDPCEKPPSWSTTTTSFKDVKSKFVVLWICKHRFAYTVFIILHVLCTYLYHHRQMNADTVYNLLGMIWHSLVGRYQCLESHTFFILWTFHEVEGSMFLSNISTHILIYIYPTICACQILFYLTTALHVLGVTITHLQEHKTTVTTASGNRYATHNTLTSI